MTGLLDQLRQRYDLASLERDEHYCPSEPDAVVWDWYDGFLFSDRIRREFLSPAFHWKTRDGRRFSGKPELVTTQREWRSWRSAGVRTEMDHIAMINGLAEMIERSIERGADEPAGLDAISGKK